MGELTFEKIPFIDLIISGNSEKDHHDPSATKMLRLVLEMLEFCRTSFWEILYCAIL